MRQLTAMEAARKSVAIPAASVLDDTASFCGGFITTRLSSEWR